MENIALTLENVTGKGLGFKLKEWIHICNYR